MLLCEHLLRECHFQLECIHGILTPRASSYVARSIPPVLSRIFMSTSYVADRNYHVQFRKGWSNGVKNRLDLYQVQKRPTLKNSSSRIAKAFTDVIVNEKQST